MAAPDLKADGIPDLWVRKPRSGNVDVHYGTTTAIGTSKTIVKGDWTTLKVLG